VWSSSELPRILLFVVLATDHGSLAEYIAKSMERLVASTVTTAKYE